MGGKAQSDGYRAVAGDLRLATAQFEELEGFSRFGTELDDETRRVLRQGRRVRAVLAQGPLETVPVGEQLVVLWATVGGAFDCGGAGAAWRRRRRACARASRDEAPAVLQRLEAGAVLDDDDRARIEELALAVAGSRGGGRRWRRVRCCGARCAARRRCARWSAR